MQMDETLNALTEQVAAFCQKVIAPRASEIDHSNVFPRDLWPQMGELGLHGITVAEEYDGVSLGYLAHVLVMEQVSRASASLRAAPSQPVAAKPRPAIRSASSSCFACGSAISSPPPADRHSHSAPLPAPVPARPS